MEDLVEIVPNLKRISMGIFLLNKITKLRLIDLIFQDSDF
jgi:hypothetical protein